MQRVYIDSFLQREDIDKVLELGEKAENAEKNNQITELKAKKTVSLPFEEANSKQLVRMETSIYEENSIPVNKKMAGPALVIMNGSTIVVEPGWKCLKNSNSNFELFFDEEQSKYKKEAEQSGVIDKNPIMLSIFGQRFMSIAE